MTGNWRLIDTGFHTAPENLAIDEALFSTYSVENQPILRIYGWKNALSIGRFQKVAEVLEMEALDQGGISWSRRITGGGVMLHEYDLSYTLVFPKKGFLPEQSIKDSYRYLCGFLMPVYKQLGLKAEFSGQNPQASTGKHTVCHAAHEQYDITVNGEKIGGNAQKWVRDKVFHHGSIPLSLNLESLNAYVREKISGSESQSLETLGVDIGFEALKEILLESFQNYFGIGLENEALNSQEQQQYKWLLEHKYMHERWLLDAKDDIAA